MALTLGSLFAGIGGFDLGFTRAGFASAFAVEIEPDCQRVLAHHWPHTVRRRDVRECGTHNLPRVDVITFGSPCQDLSVAGRRAGIGGARSGLFFEAIRIIGELRPALAIWENVPGALSSHGGRDFGAALDALADLGAVAIGWAVLDAQWFGVAQRRRRVFVVASFRDWADPAEILSLADGLSGHPPPRRETGQGVAGTLGGGAGTRGWASDTDRMTFVPDVYQCQGSNVGALGTLRRGNGHVSGGVPFVAHALTTPSGQRMEPSSDTLVLGSLELGNQGSGGNVGWPSPHSPTRTLDTSGPLGVAYSVAVRGRDRGQEWELGEPDVGNALRAGDGGSSRGNWALTPQMAVRRLTPTECLRLQGFPDDWLDLDPPLSDSAKYRMTGNAVAVPVAEWLGRRIMEVA